MANEIESDEELNATQLDAQRARQLLHRALGLSERGDIAGAIVTCRQSLALAPNSSQGWSMLGLLHERDGDIDGAIEAYEKTLQLASGSSFERESLQRLRQKRGTAPRPAPKFEFDTISSNAPQAPPETWFQPSVPQTIQPSMSEPDTVDWEATKSLWDTFYFRSLPVLVTVIACLGLILVAQRVAAKRQMQQLQRMPAVATSSEAPLTPSSQAPTIAPDPPAPVVTPSTLAPPAQREAANSSEAVASPSKPAAPAPVIVPRPETPKPKPAAKPKPKPQPRPTPRSQAPSEMPVLPPPRLTLPKRPATTPSPQNEDDGAANAAGSGGPVDVGNAEDSRYIPINPPSFPNASRN